MRLLTCVALLSSLAVSLVVPMRAHAHGGTVVALDEDTGPYHMVVVTGSTGVNRMVMTIILTTRTTGDEVSQPVVGAQLRYVVTEVRSQSVAATSPVPPEPKLEQSGYYETYITLPGERDANVSIDVAGSLGTASANFPVKGQPGWLQWFNSYGDWVISLSVLALMGVFIFLSKRPDARASTTTAPQNQESRPQK
jgi:hypothetical protein